MDYEMKYKAVLKTATQWIKDGCTDKERICLECVFPELAESEDERIRKEMISFLRSPFIKENLTDEKVAPWIAYLEKQKERDLDIVPELRPTAWGEGYQHGCKDTEEKYSGMMVCSQKEWGEAISDAFKHGMDEGKKQKEPHWKPSEEQMESLRRAVDKLAKIDVVASVSLSIMYDNLKKLKEDQQ